MTTLRERFAALFSSLTPQQRAAVDTFRSDVSSYYAPYRRAISGALNSAGVNPSLIKNQLDGYASGLFQTGEALADKASTIAYAPAPAPNPVAAKAGRLAAMGRAYEGGGMAQTIRGASASAATAASAAATLSSAVTASPAVGGPIARYTAPGQKG